MLSLITEWINKGRSLIVVPAKAGTQCRLYRRRWIPAFAGMTMLGGARGRIFGTNPISEYSLTKQKPLALRAECSRFMFSSHNAPQRGAVVGLGHDGFDFRCGTQVDLPLFGFGCFTSLGGLAPWRYSGISCRSTWRKIASVNGGSASDRYWRSASFIIVW